MKRETANYVPEPDIKQIM